MEVLCIRTWVGSGIFSINDVSFDVIEVPELVQCVTLAVDVNILAVLVGKSSLDVAELV